MFLFLGVWSSTLLLLVSIQCFYVLQATLKQYTYSNWKCQKTSESCINYELSVVGIILKKNVQ